MKKHLEVCTYREYLANLIRKKNPNARLEDIEDCVQNTLIKATRHIEQWKGECSLKTWLTIIALRMYSESFRKKYTHQEYVLSSLKDAYIFENINHFFFYPILFRIKIFASFYCLYFHNLHP